MGLASRTLRIASVEDASQFSVRLGNSVGAVSALVNGFLARTDEMSIPRPALLERLPSQDDGTWVLQSDGTMRTVLNLRPGLLWQDGYPITAQDIAFAYRVYSDATIPLDTQLPEQLISGVRVVDDRTAEVSWTRPYFGAGRPRDGDLAPLPSHLLEPLHTRDKFAFMNSSFWTSNDYVGAGPFRLAERHPGITMTFAANPFFHFGKPAIDKVEIRVIPDKNVIVTRLLSGEVDFAEYSSLLEQQAGLLRDRWTVNGAGSVYGSFFQTRGMEFQHRSVPNHQPALTDVRVRQALMHAVDRELMAAALSRGLSAPADSFYSREDPLWPRLEQAVMRYAYDPRRVEALLVDAGWSRGPDRLFRNARGSLFEVQIIATPDHPREAPLIADYWRQAGMASRVIQMPEAAKEDEEYRANFAGVLVNNGNPGSYSIYTARQVPNAENRFRGRNRGSYVNREVEQLSQRLETSLNPVERDDIIVALERMISVDVAVGHLYYLVRPAAARSNVIGVKGLSKGSASTYLFNVWEWSV